MIYTADFFWWSYQKLCPAEQSPAEIYTVNIHYQIMNNLKNMNKSIDRSECMKD